MEPGTTERLKLAFVVAGPRYAQALKAEQGDVDFYDIKAIVESLFEKLGTKGIRYQAPRAGGGGVGALFHPGQTVEILAGRDSAGFVGLLHPGVARSLKARAPLWIAELDAEALRKLSRAATGPGSARVFKGWSEHPSIERDFALLVKDDVTAEKITQVALKAGRPLAKVAKVFDIYRGSQVAQGMTSIAVRVIFNEDQRSLQEAEAETASKQILEAWRKELGAELRG
jgi:phenylalanyl-tRNA synthetase beta chain